MNGWIWILELMNVRFTIFQLSHCSWIILISTNKRCVNFYISTVSFELLFNVYICIFEFRFYFLEFIIEILQITFNGTLGIAHSHVREKCWITEIMELCDFSEGETTRRNQFSKFFPLHLLTSISFYEPCNIIYQLLPNLQIIMFPLFTFIFHLFT